MAAFLAVVALGALISYAIMTWRDDNAWVRRLARVGVSVLVLGILLEVVVNLTTVFPLQPGWSFMLGTALAFGFAFPGMLIHAMPK
ncbi:Na+-transporting NADH:ubiquinone oxidoreductase subunit NqrB [Natronospira proteinivora]|uniref:Na+-transporting NADH:ubiquinone oxidoreductase subunit NqrB n=1 Tax=Natronospira proteinivora TaxID=1807133 RepID=A0ABT1GBI4_9GAMM|nr:hypothetical protein [Natronospira proteinivora]MCP1728641.1 Na+-transporting NADH:ubiquinone oxidoreductase subunit NqrB [Natronospira proteinivora]